MFNRLLPASMDCGAAAADGAQDLEVAEKRPDLQDCRRKASNYVRQLLKQLDWVNCLPSDVDVDMIISLSDRVTVAGSLGWMKTFP